MYKIRMYSELLIKTTKYCMLVNQKNREKSNYLFAISIQVLPPEIN